MSKPIYVIETGDGKLPPLRKIYLNLKSAKNFIKKFMEENLQEGEIYLYEGHHKTVLGYVRQRAYGIVEIEHFDDDGERSVSYV